MGVGKGRQKRINSFVKTVETINKDEAIKLFEMNDDVLPKGFSIEINDEKMVYAYGGIAHYDITYNDKAVGRMEYYLGFVGDHPSMDMKIDRIIIEEDFKDLRGSGLGTAVIEETIKQAKSIGVENIDLTAVEDGRWFWRRFGFQAETLDGYFRKDKLKEAESILEIYDAYVSELTKSDWRRWKYFKNSFLKDENKDLNMFMIHDFKLSNGQTIADVVQLPETREVINPSMIETALGWKGRFSINQGSS